MSTIKKIAKALRLKQVSAKINFNASVSVHQKKYTIPVIKNVGLPNLFLKNDWFLDLLEDRIPLQPGSAFIDVGANVGQTLLAFRSRYDNPYFGFEPNPTCVFYLKELIDANRLKDVFILPVGLSSHNTVAKLYLKDGSDSGATLIEDLRPGLYQPHEVAVIPVFRFDELQLTGLEQISLIKIDVEGAELEVILGLTETLKKHRPTIICEVLDSNSEENLPKLQARADELMQHLRNLNYRVFRIRAGEKNKEVQLEEISEIRLKKWTSESVEMNDYLFMPSSDSSC